MNKLINIQLTNHNAEEILETLIRNGYDLLNFRESHLVIKIKLPTDNISYLSLLEDELSSGSHFSISFEPAKQRYSSEKIWEKFHQNLLCANLNNEILEKRLNKISDRFNEIDDDNINSLFLTIGNLRWFDKTKDGDIIQKDSPVLFLSLQISKNENSEFKFCLNIQGASLNLQLFRYLKNEYGLELSSFNHGLPKDEHGVDLKKVFVEIDEEISKINSDWDIKYDIHVGHIRKKFQKLEEWKNKQFNLANNNYDFLNFRESAKTIKILTPEGSEREFISELEDRLYENERFSFITIDKTRKTHSDEIHQQFENNKLCLNITNKEISTSLLKIFNQYVVNNQETGNSSLFLALGMLERFEKSPIISPIIFIPIEISRKGLKTFEISIGDDEPRVNATLINKLKEEYYLEFPLIEDYLPSDEHGIDIPKILTHIEEVITNHDPLWSVKNTAYIGHFSFAKYLMWRDLEEIDVEYLLKTNPLFAKLVDPATHQFRDTTSFPNEESLDNDYPPDQVYCPLSADSSQLAAVIAGVQGKTFVLYGPPGTGKSQTITNIIANCLANNKRVLFVSEKKVALEVVYERLSGIGLSPFCLELHSNKGNKRAVLDQFKDSINDLDAIDSDSWVEQCNNLTAIRTELNEYIDSIHRIRDTGESYYYGISQLSKLRTLPNLKIYESTEWVEYDKFSKNDLKYRRECISLLSNYLKNIGDPLTHPWKESQECEWSPQFRNNIEELLKQINQQLLVLRSASTVLFKLIFHGIKDPHDISINSFLRLITIFYNNKYLIPLELLRASNFESLETQFNNLIEIGKERDELKSIILSKYSPEIFGVDTQYLDELISHDGAIGKLLSRKKVKKLLNTYSIEEPGDWEDLLEDINNLIKFSDMQENIDILSEDSEKVFGIFWNEGYPDWDNLSIIIETGKKLRTVVQSIGSDEEQKNILLTNWFKIIQALLKKNEKSTRFKKVMFETHQSIKELLQLVYKLCSSLKIEKTLINNNHDVFTVITNIEEKINLWKAGINQLHDWCRYQEIRKRSVQLGLESLITAVESDYNLCERLEELFDRSYYQWWVESIRNDEPQIQKFYRPDHEKSIQHLIRIDEEYRRLTEREIRLLLSKRLLDWNAVQEREKGLLNKQISLKRNNLPFRLLFQNISKILPLIKPCMLMSPLSVAQYIPLDEKKFDLVIFDEASQIPIWDAMGAIVRANQAIIVGDPKQMPPTNFFTMVAQGDTGLDQDLESVLDDCIAANIPEMYLKWHYRSRHESLIAFSNYYFYKNSLRTFPSPHTNSAVTLHKIQGVYDGGNSRTNEIEASAIVSYIVTRLSDPDFASDSIGVVTFNQPQRDLIADLLEKAKSDNPQISRFFNENDTSSLFIKNLENVQGDERDIIVFSVTFGPDYNGNISLNLGPLNKSGGERRLNVAITRAKKEIVIFSSLRPEMMNVDNLQGEGVILLKKFLQYAERGMDAIKEACSIGIGDYESPLEEEVGNAIKNMGYEIHPQVGCGGYRIDIGVVDPDYPGRYLLGVECDGARYHSFKTARDRDLLREEVLRGLGWEIYRIWSTDWWENQQGEVERLRHKLENLRISMRLM